MTSVSSGASASVVTPIDIPLQQRRHLRAYRTWQRFRRGPRSTGEPLLKSVARYPDAVFVAGCQRSGTTMLTRIIARSPGFSQLQLTRDDELDAALVLGGFVDLPTDRRYCFQTTYLNECFHEYSRIGAGQRLIWVIRNPYSVVQSMVYNWKAFALNELYVHCGASPESLEQRQHLARWPWPLGISRVERAASAYAGKSRQIFKILDLVGRDRVLLVDYDALVSNAHESLRRVFDFLGLEYRSEYADAVKSTSKGKAANQSQEMRRHIGELALPAYDDCRRLLKT